MVQFQTQTPFQKVITSPLGWMWAVNFPDIPAASDKATTKDLSLDAMNDIHWPASGHPQSEPVFGWRLCYCLQVSAITGPGEPKIQVRFSVPVAIGGTGTVFTAFSKDFVAGMNVLIDPEETPIFPAMSDVDIVLQNTSVASVSVEGYITLRAA